ncbi:mannose-specific PTS system EIID component [Escherichia coli]|uniref:Mannose-specific PTS system EIID component n=1 Tax=Escherichia coli TaxID=562 RepID=A0A3S4MAA6_ECOLX|nr:mannose-specific PTS system EIID component [Escherichia coli]
MVTPKGIDIVKDMGGGFLQKLTEGASILGLFVMGALVNKWTHVNIPLVVSRITDQTGKETRYHCPDYSGPVNARPGTTAADLCLYVATAQKS